MKWASRPGRGLYRRIIAKDTRAVRDFVLDKIILAPGNEVTRALTTRRLIANYEPESFPPFLASRMHRNELIVRSTIFFFLGKP